MVANLLLSIWSTALPAPEIHYDAATRTVVRDGETMTLPYKTWQVLSTLRGAAGNVLTRADLIARIWGGNHLVGEKGLTQAVWSIRQVVGDDARSPRYLETIPRVGYRWLDSSSTALSSPRLRRSWNVFSLSAVATVAVMVLGGVVFLRAESLPTPTAEELMGAQLIAGADKLVVEMVAGCRRIFVADDNMRFGVSQLSDDGQRILVEVIQASQCRMVEYNMLTNKRHEFASCLTANPI